ncbi:MAG: DMT family transporter [Bacteroidales bacterium]|nr:DMT family transporter [Bacteroidales bacterium]
MYKGELISITVAISWTACAMFAEVASKRVGSLPLNVVRMLLSLIMLAAVMWWFTGVPYPVGANADTWLWLSLSGLVGYVLGDFCFFNSYILIGSRYGQLLMTLAPPVAALFGWLLLGQSMTWMAILGMTITILGIATAIYRPRKESGAGTNGGEASETTPRLPLRGILFGIGAGIGQGMGLVLSAKGLMHYEALQQLAGVAYQHGGNAALVLPFASTAIRAVTGLIGFTLWTFARGEAPQLRKAFTDRRAMLFALAATITGPFIGVSLSLMATLYTSIGIAQTIMAMTPVLIIWPTYLFFHQRIHWREVVGAIVSVCGVALFFV